MLTEKQSQMFIDFYHKLYNVKKGDPKPHIKVEDEQEHERLWRKQVRKMLGKQAREIYKYRSYGKQTREDKVFQGLRLQYGPILDYPKKNEKRKKKEKKALNISQKIKNLFSKLTKWMKRS